MVKHQYSGVEYILNYDQKMYKNLTHQAKLKFNEQVYALGGEPSVLKMQFTLTPSFITQEQFNKYKKCCDQFNAIIEKIGEYIFAENKDLIEFFPAYLPYIPYTKNKKYLHNLYCRYDFFIDESNEIQFCETNSHGGGGFVMFSLISQILYEYLKLQEKAIPQTYQNEFYFCKGISVLEQYNHIKPGAIAILYDDTPFFHPHTITFFELKALVKQLISWGRKAFLVNVKDLTLNKKNELCYDNHIISTTFNKFSINGRNITKDPQYAAFLQAVKHNTVLPINSIIGMTFLEDKALFALLTDPKYHYLLTNEEMNFIRQHIPQTTRLIPKHPDLNNFIRNKNNYVLKPANLARGKGVYIGQNIAEEEWNELMITYATEDYIMQEKINTQPIDIFHIIDDQLTVDKMHQIYSAYYLGGELMGFIDRVSIEPVTNIHSTAYGHPVFILK